MGDMMRGIVINDYLTPKGAKMFVNCMNNLDEEASQDFNNLLVDLEEVCDGGEIGIVLSAVVYQAMRLFDFYNELDMKPKDKGDELYARRIKLFPTESEGDK